jgi:hypothetical protein
LPMMARRTSGQSSLRRDRKSGSSCSTVSPCTARRAGATAGAGARCASRQRAAPVDSARAVASQPFQPGLQGPQQPQRQQRSPRPAAAAGGRQRPPPAGSAGGEAAAGQRPEALPHPPCPVWVPAPSPLWPARSAPAGWRRRQSP